MHDNSILHRDIKPENIVMTNVHIYLSRELASYVISDGRLSAKTEELPIVAL